MKLIIFGVGEEYRKKKHLISDMDEIVAFLDNNPSLWGSQMDGKSVYCPRYIQRLTYDKIILMSIYAAEMREQLLSFGCRQEKIMRHTEYIAGQYRGEMQVLFSVQAKGRCRERCLIITTDLGYHGGTMAAVYAAFALRDKGYGTLIAAPGGNPEFIREMRELGISFIIYKNLAHIQMDELFWMESFSFILVNTLPMICCALQIAKNRKVSFWLHESQIIYPSMEYWREDIEGNIKQDNLDVYAVSSVARENFIRNYFRIPIKLLPYGIPDEYFVEKKEYKKKLVFAMVGSIVEIKGQDIFLDAAQKVREKGQDASFWIIGKHPGSEYGKSIEECAARQPDIEMLGELSRTEMRIRYLEIDVCVVPSREDCLPIAASEAMMHGKACIVSDVTGTADYVVDGINGFVFPIGDSGKLAEKMLWCIENSGKLGDIGKEARKTYENNFTMEIFSRNLEFLHHRS